MYLRTQSLQCSSLVEILKRNQQGIKSSLSFCFHQTLSLCAVGTPPHPGTAPKEILKEHCLLPAIHTRTLFSTQTDHVSLCLSETYRTLSSSTQWSEGIHLSFRFVCLFIKINILKVQLDQVIESIGGVSCKEGKVAKFEGANLRGFQEKGTRSADKGCHLKGIFSLPDVFLDVLGFTCVVVKNCVL